VREYPHVAELLRFVNAAESAQSLQSSFLLKSLQTSLETIPLDYAGPQAEEIAAFRAELSTMIHSAELREAMERKAEEERIAALKASGIPYVGMLEEEVNSTRQLGKAYRSGTNRERVKLEDGSYGQKEWQYYCWYSKSDGDIVFKAECEGGLVFNVVKYGGDACWDGDKLKIKLGPQKIQTFNSGGASNLPPSVQGDYDNPEDLYEDNRDWYSDEEEAWDEWYDG